jgi:hypothetical protein
VPFLGNRRATRASTGDDPIRKLVNCLSSRSVPMHDRVGQALERHFQASNYQADDDLVFGHPHTAAR